MAVQEFEEAARRDADSIHGIFIFRLFVFAWSWAVCSVSVTRKPGRTRTCFWDSGSPSTPSQRTRFRCGLPEPDACCCSLARRERRTSAATVRQLSAACEEQEEGCAAVIFRTYVRPQSLLYARKRYIGLRTQWLSQLCDVRRFHDFYFHVLGDANLVAHARQANDLKRE